MCRHSTSLIWLLALVGSGLALSACDERSDPVQQTREATIGPELFEAYIGEVHFPVSCSQESAQAAERGLALLHHMMYEEARLMFGLAANLDSSCAMAYWGQAMTWVHPLWPDRPSQEELEMGRELIARALATEPPTDRELAYIHAARAYFEPQPDDTEADRLARFDRAWAAVADQHPEDPEARALAALAHIATASFEDKSFAAQQRAATMVQSVLQELPDHPGGHHYYIHALDNPAHAKSALRIADRYGALTPVVPHATHMMTHIYTRLGEWQKSIEWNRKSADAAWELCTTTGEISSHYAHALDYLVYAYLQLGADAEALAAATEATAVSGPYSALNLVATAYALSAIPARYALERRDWASAAALTPRQPADFPWGPEHAPYEAITYFARALGHAQLGDTHAARVAIVELHRLAAELRNVDLYWAKQVEIQSHAAAAWVAQAEGEHAYALTQMRRAVALEASTEKNPVTPGEVLPARELLGDLYQAQGQPQAALAAYRASLERSPRRLNSVLGAMRAAQAAGLREDAEQYRATLQALVDPRATRPDLRAITQSARS